MPKNNPRMEPENVLKTPLADFYVKEGILYSSIHTDEMDLAASKSFVETVLTNYGSLLPLPLVIITTGRMKNMKKEARDYWV